MQRKFLKICLLDKIIDKFHICFSLLGILDGITYDNGVNGFTQAD